MNDHEDEIIEDDGTEDDGDFNPDDLDLNQLEDAEEGRDEIEPITGRVPPFLARLQWWGFTFLILFIVIVALRMIFGPPWIDRFRHARYPVAIDQANGMIGVIIPKIVNSTRLSYHLIFVDKDGNVLQHQNLGMNTPGPVDLTLSREKYFYIAGEGSWVAGRPYVQTGETGNFDIDLNQFDWKLRNGIDLLVSDDGTEYLNVFNDQDLITLSYQNGIWEIVNKYSSTDWGLPDFLMTNQDGYYAVGQAGAEVLLLEFPNFIDGFKKPESEILLASVPPRPQFQGEFIYSPAKVVSANRISSFIDFVIVKNDRMFNLPYKYMDDQVYIKLTNEIEPKVFNEPFFSGKDIRGFVFSMAGDSESTKADYAVLYGNYDEFRLAAVKQGRSKPYWDISLTSVLQEN